MGSIMKKTGGVGMQLVCIPRPDPQMFFIPSVQAYTELSKLDTDTDIEQSWFYCEKVWRYNVWRYNFFTRSLLAEFEGG